MTIFVKHNQYFAHWCEGCNLLHLVPDFDGKPRWSFNGDFSKPTLSPSVLLMVERRCHYFIRDGKIQYCSDCFHDLKNTERPLAEIPIEEMEWLK